MGLTIIPPSLFKKKETVSEEVESVSPSVEQKQMIEPEPQPSAPLENNAPVVSAYSIKGIKQRKEMEKSLNIVGILPKDMPQTDFSETDLRDVWKSLEQQFSASNPNMASVMNIAEPSIQLEGFLVKIKMPNEGSKITFNEHKRTLLEIIKEKLNNYSIDIEISVDESVEIKKNIYTPREKYEYLCEINPDLAYLFKKFELELD